MKRSLQRLYVTATLAVMLTACATPYDTEKNFWSFGEGFETLQIAPDGWQISFVGNTNTDRALAKKYILLKSAEVCQQAGYPFFTFTSEQTDRDSVGQFGVGGDVGSDLILGSSIIDKETSVIVEVTGLNRKTDNTNSRIYDTDFILANVNVKD